MSSRRRAVLYISYDGLLEPLGQSQVLQYLMELARDRPIVLVTYEKKADLDDRPRVTSLAAVVAAAGIQWKRLRYHRKPSGLATAYDLLTGLIVCSALVSRHRIGLVHARSYVPSVLALILQRVFGIRFVFDMRGFWADERVEGRIWAAGSRMYRVAKWFERHFLESADRVVSLTRAGAEILRNFPIERESPLQIDVIPTCTNLDMFRPGEKREPAPFTLGYVGSVGTWYLFPAVLESFRTLLEIRPDARLLIVNRNDHELIHRQVRESGLDGSAIMVQAADFADVPATMRKMDAGVFFIRPLFSKKGSAPTKLGEFLGCGIPCLSNSGVGDVDTVLNDRVGVVIHDPEAGIPLQAMQKLVELSEDERTRERCVDLAQKHFSLGSGVDAYRRIYQELLEPAA